MSMYYEAAIRHQVCIFNKSIRDGACGQQKPKEGDGSLMKIDTTSLMMSKREQSV